MAKKVTGYVKLQVPAGAANPSPPIGPALGQRGLNIMEFCKAFNARTAQMGEGDADPRRHHGLSGPLLTFDMKQPPVSYFLKRAVGLKIGKKPASGSKTPWQGSERRPDHRGSDREIAEKKMVDMNSRTSRRR
jgi:large subunit ribosomal protein L11